MKISKRFQPQLFEHINILESSKQPGIDNKCSNSSLKWFLMLKWKSKVFFLQKNSEVR